MIKSMKNKIRKTQKEEIPLKKGIFISFLLMIFYPRLVVTGKMWPFIAEIELTSWV